MSSSTFLPWKTRLLRRGVQTACLLFALAQSTTQLLPGAAATMTGDDLDSQIVLGMPSSSTPSAGAAINITEEARQSLWWGTYRPNLYFGTRPRLPDSLMTGLMWFGLQDYDGIDNIRHGCEERDGFEKYGWLKHDGRQYGLQEIKDTRNNLDMTTQFLKVPGGEFGGSWGAKISGKPLREGEPMMVSFLYYVGLDHEGNLRVESSKENANTIKIHGSGFDLGQYEMDITVNRGSFIDGKTSKIRFAGARIPAKSAWRAKDYARGKIVQDANEKRAQGMEDGMPHEYFELPNKMLSEDASNFVMLQMNFDSEFQFDILFDSKDSPQRIDREKLAVGLVTAEKDFDDRFERVFGLQAKGYNAKEVAFAKATMSNLVGGIGYFYGSSIVDKSPTYEEGENEHLEGPVARRPNPNPQMSEPASLFSAVPSRSFFPRGFYWDEGFHQNLIGVWDNDLSLEIIKSWYDRQDEDGWIQREQILGDEPRSRVPAEFQIQYPEHGNPPTLVTALCGYLDRVADAAANKVFGVVQPDVGVMPTDPTAAKTATATTAAGRRDETNRMLDRANEYLSELYPKLRTNYFWMRNTMQGGIREFGRMSARSRTEGYRWRGRTPSHTLTSGLDDYPRAAVPSVGELHVDLLSWIGFYAKQLARIAELMDLPDDVDEYEDHYDAIKGNIDDLHWNEEKKMFCDLSLDENSESVYVCHKGYISLFPLALGLIDPQSDKLGHVLDMIHNPDELWSPYGLRSLSKQDEFFATGENYWKGPIWINLNFLVLRSLKANYMVEGPHQERVKTVYNELRDNLIRNIYKEYERTGYVWEQYDEASGEGRRSHPFTGWTSMVVLMMTMGRA
ncbi:Processing alpha glucosidase I [Actinomortierella ambigua]|uniref:Mannosyl-oligosaccharide glucosidase n=1 Tax=Actinomortierella ambigua TaxID=1343610 RepID=A0A9P6QED7_9FUNG|nr:Processing alpha glucosidase I [Actinomortierella ambigua]